MQTGRSWDFITSTNWTVLSGYGRFRMIRRFKAYIDI